MANEAFALSPMSARAAEPNEQDYDAIREAFMETARGRWFLGEYAKRNRNADTRMVLDAVAKIEETLSAQRQPVVVDRLPEALIAIRRAVEETEAVAANATNPAAIVAALAPIQRGVRIIKEISWRWREIGADGRICDLIDSQLAAIEGACAQVSGVDPRAELKAAFDLLRDRIAQTDGGAAAEPAASSVAEAAPTAMPNETPVVFTEPQDIATSALPAADEAAEAEAAMDAAFAQDGAVAGDEGAPETVAFGETVAEPAAIAEIEAELSFDAAADAEDEAVLEAIALEMAAPDPDFDEIIEPVEMAAADPEPMSAEVAQADAAPIIEEPVAAATSQAADEAAVTMESLARLTDAIADAAAEVDLMELPAITADAAPVATLPMPSPVTAAAPEPSLGATILASGMLQKPRSSMNDPLAPLRRMTQAEKIAFFS